MGSTRLPGKVLKDINGRPMLSYMLERVLAAKTIDQVAIATSVELSDNQIAEFCQGENITCYRGSLEDVLDRYYQTALKLKCDVVVRLTADCPLIDPEIIDAVVDMYQSNDYDFVANTIPPNATFPDGMDVEVFSVELLERAWREAKKSSEREHVTFYFWKNPQIFSIYRYDIPENLSKYRLTVDYYEDFEVVSCLIKELYPQNFLFTLTDIINFLDTHPNIMKRNMGIISNQGWHPALEGDKKQGYS